MLEQIEQRHLTARAGPESLGRGARYAGAKDRAFVSGLVLDGLRHRRSLAWRMNEASPAHWLWRFSLSPGAGRSIASQSPPAMRNMAPAPWPKLNAPGPRTHSLADAPAAVRGDYPDWLAPHMERAFGDDAAAEGSALAERAPIDLRVNRLKSDVGRTAAALAPFHPAAGEMLPDALADRTAGGRRARGAGGSHAGVRKGLVRGPGLWARRSLRRRSAKSPIGRCWISAPAAAARPWRSPPRWPTQANSGPMTPTRGAWPRPSAAPAARASAISRSAAR